METDALTELREYFLRLKAVSKQRVEMFWIAHCGARLEGFKAGAILRVKRP